ncbi:MAG: hypothetical protein BGO55_31480 [Sphingobacteriales bacterium 50-39]|nr:alpha-L-fucosidase [Sphingobacteriales bacterium]OJW61025.1 MAG: hypothetical protein BGO55_31480 [Sphingobacteriales bacterium 50-39]
MKKIFLSLVTILFAATCFCQTTLVNPRTDMKLLRRFQDGKLGMFIHWMACFTPATGDSWEIGRKTPKRVADSITYAWDPEKFDAKAIVDFAVRAGCKYITVISKHHDGFCIWDSKYTSFDLERVKFKKDILAELGREAHRRGLLFGIYYSILDINQMGWDKMPFEISTQPEPTGGKAAFVQYIHDQVKELLTRYSPDIMWFDGYWLKQYWTNEDGRNLYEDIKKTKPNTLSRGLSSTRNDKDEDIFVPDGSAGDYLCIEAKTSEGPSYPWEACTSVSYPVYAYDPSAPLKSKKDLITMFDKEICGNGNFLLNIGPDRDGTLPKALTDRFLEVSDWVLKNKQAIYNTSGGPFKQGTWGGSTYKGNHIYLHLRQPDQEITLNELKGYTVLSAKDAATGESLKLTRTATGYLIQAPRVGDDNIIAVIALQLDKPFVFSGWLSLN